MSQTTESTTPPGKGYVDFDVFVDFHLDKAQSSIKTTEVTTVLVGLGAFVLCYLLAFVVVDQWVLADGFSDTTRLLLSSGALLTLLGVLGFRVVYPLLRRIHPLYAARMLERAEPSLKSNLLNLVDSRETAHGEAPVFRAMEKRAAAELAHVDVEQAVDRRTLLHTSYVLLAMVLACCLYAVFSPKDLFTSMRRALFPLSTVAVPTQTVISDVTPGDTRVPARGLLTVEADIRGRIPPQITLYYTTADHKFVDQPVEMRRIEDNGLRFRGMILGENGRGLLQDIVYRIEAGDYRTQNYSVTVIQPPSAKVERVKYVFPPYTKLPEKTESSGNIDAWEGSTVTVTATANTPVRSARLRLTDAETTQGKGEELAMRVRDGIHLEAEWKLTFRSDGTAPRFYHVQFTTEKGEADPAPTHYSLRIRPDQPPEVALLAPRGDLEMPANGVIPLVIQASDPDFELRYLTLKAVMSAGTGAANGNGGEFVDERLFEGQTLGQTFLGRYDFALARRGLKAGDKFQFWIEAKDNRQPTANRKTTSRLNVSIVEPVSPEQVQRQLAQDKRLQKQDQLAMNDGERNQQPNETKPPQEGTDAKPPEDPKNKDDKPPQKTDAATDNPPPADDQKPAPEGATPPQQETPPKTPASNHEALNKLLRDQLQKEQQEPKPENPQPGQKPDQPKPDQESPAKPSGKPGNEGKTGRDQNQNKPGDKTNTPSPGNEPRDSQDNQPKQNGVGPDNPKPNPKAPGKQPSGKQQPGARQPDQGKSPDSPKPEEGTSPGQAPPEKQDPKQPPASGKQQPKENPQQSPANKDPKKNPETPGQNPPPEQVGPSENKDNPKEPQKPGGKPGDRTKPDAPKQPGQKPSDPSQEQKPQPGQNPGEKPKDPNTPDKPGQQEQPGTKPTPKDPGGKPETTGKTPDNVNKPDQPGTQKPEPGEKDPKVEGPPNPQDKTPAVKEPGKEGKDNTPSTDKPAGPGKQDPKTKPDNDPKTDGQTPSTDNTPQPDAPKNPGEAPAPNKNVPKGDGPGKQAPGTKPPSPGKPTPGEDLSRGKETPAPENPEAKKVPATGDEQGPATPDRDPNAVGPKAKNDLTKKPDSPPGTRRDGEEGKTPPKTTEKVEGPAPPNARPQKTDPKTKPQDKVPGEPRPQSDQVADNTPGKPQTDKKDQQTRPGTQEAPKPAEGTTPDSKGKENKPAPSSKEAPKQPGSKPQEGAKTDPKSSSPPKDGTPAPAQPGPSDSSKGPPSDSTDGPGKKPGPPQSGGKPKPGAPSDGPSTVKSDSPEPGKGPGGVGTEKPKDPTSGNVGGGPGNQGKGDLGDGAPAGPGDEANLDYARKATNLVLKKLKGDLKRGQVDPELLKELGWTKERMQQFVQQLEKQVQDPGDDTSPEAVARRVQFEETLKNLHRGSQTQARRGDSLHETRTQNTGGRSAVIPPEYRQQYEDYTRSLSRQRNGK